MEQRLERSTMVSMEEVTTVDARNNFSDVLNRVKYGGIRLNLTRRGKVIAAIVPARDAELLSVIDALDPEHAERLRLAILAEGGIAWEEIDGEHEDKFSQEESP